MIDALGVGGGAEHALAGLIPALAEHGVESSVVCLNPRQGGIQEKLRAQGTPVTVVGEASLLQQIHRVRKVIRHVRPDIVHATIWRSCLVSRFACLGIDVRLMNSIVATSYDPIRTSSMGVAVWKLALIRWTDRITLRTVDRVHVLTNAVADEARKVLGVPETKLVVIPRGRSRPTLGWRSEERRTAVRRELGITAGTFVVLNAGRQDSQKAQELLVAAFAEVSQAVPDSMLLIAGRPGDASNRIHATISRLGLADSVRLLGHRDDVANLMVAADVFAFPSLYEGLGSVLIEAMALETAIVASDAPALVEVLDSGAAGLIVKRNDTVGLANSLQMLADSREARDRLTKRGLALFSERYDLTSVVVATVLAYGLLSQSRRPNGRRE